MTESQYSLSWSAHKSNICSGLSSLQQNSEFVDMTLAADGHHVKVHQVIMALASPYIKELISTAHCPHPVIFLNKISYITLSAILEYIYTGEVLVPLDNLTELIEAGKELHIKGLEDMNFDHTQTSHIRSQIAKPKSEILYEEMLRQEDPAINDDRCYFEVADKDGAKYMIYGEPPNKDQMGDKEVEEESLDDHTFDESLQVQDEEDMQTEFSQDISSQDIVIQCSTTSESNNEYSKTLEVIPKYISSKIQVASKKSLNTGDCGVLQYTVSNQGSLQLILNRFMYYLKHSRRSGARHWRCVDYLGPNRCPAIVVTNENVVVQRISAHMHAFHDKRILKKVQTGAVFGAINDAMQEGNAKKIAKENAHIEAQQSEEHLL